MSALSVFIVTYNSAPLLRSCLNSLRAQTLGEVEIIVVDNASRDDSAAIIRAEYPEIKLIAGAVNLGFGNANNLALAEAKGRYIVLLNPDAVLPADTLERALAHMEETPDAGMGGGLLQGTQGEWQPSARQFPSLLNDGLTLSGLANRYPNSHFFGRFDRSWADPLASGGGRLGAGRFCDYTPEPGRANRSVRPALFPVLRRSRSVPPYSSGRF